MVNRRMFRPGFPDVKEPSIPRPQHNGPIPSKKPAPPETTHAENFYWVKQMQARTPMTIVMADGEVLRGTVEWYDRDCIKRSEEHTSELQSRGHLVCRLLLEKKNMTPRRTGSCKS